ncbi:MAG TPA: SDR family NAD(P)-dependent oxidoreductase [bacterium]|nr:SDR family NAD(P)-dependent oxidoreductase [bacterium]
MTTPQSPIHSGFGPASTAEEVIQGIDLTGQTAIVTGGYSGLGLETARVLRQAGAQVLVPARDVPRAQDALKGLGIAVEPMDLMDPASIDAFADRFLKGLTTLSPATGSNGLATGQSLSLLINSAGIMACPLTRDSRGYESQFSTNHLGHFQLTLKLWPALKAAQCARVVSLSSWGHRHSPVVFEDPNFERREYTPWLGYGQSKTANILFALELDRRGEADGIRAFSVHPGGIVATGLGKYITPEQLKAGGAVDEKGQPVIDPERGFKTVEQGAATSVWCATSPSLKGMGGVYCQDCDVAPVVDLTSDAAKKFASKPLGVMPYAVDPEAAKRLWELSERLTGTKGRE